MMWTAASAASLASLKKSLTVMFIAGYGNFLVFRISAFGGVGISVFQVLCFLEDYLRGSVRLRWGFRFLIIAVASFCLWASAVP